MDFELTEAQNEIVRQVRTLCADFPDEYWREHDLAPSFLTTSTRRSRKLATWASRFRSNTAAADSVSPKLLS